MEYQKCLNMHKSRYKLTKKRNKCDVTVKSTITKRTKVEKKLLKQLKNPLKEKQNWRGGERENIDIFFFFFCKQFGRNRREWWK